MLEGDLPVPSKFVQAFLRLPSLPVLPHPQQHTLALVELIQIPFLQTDPPVGLVNIDGEIIANILNGQILTNGFQLLI